MALLKNITLDNGIVLSYHRVVSVNNITNIQSIIEVSSYVNEEQRIKEKEWYESEEDNKGDMNVFIDSRFYIKEYDKDLNVDNAYEYLKTLEDFEGAEDI